MKLILACPTYGCTDPQANRSLRAAVMHAGKHGHEWLGDASPDREAFAHAREHVVKSVLEAEDKDPETYKDAAVVWIDSDVILPIDAITTLAHRGYDFITGIYVQRNCDHYPLIAHFNGTSFNWIVQFSKNSLIPIDGCGFGIVLTSLKLLRAVPKPAFEYVKFSEDFDFCLKAKKAGFGLFADTSVCCGHLSDPKPITIEDFIEGHKDLWEGKQNVRPIIEKGNVVLPKNESDKRGGPGMHDSIAV
jgi:hypothetical protein